MFYGCRQVFKDKHDYGTARTSRNRRIWEWGEEGERLFASPRSIYPNFSLVQSVGRKQSGLKSFVNKAGLLWAAAVAA